MASHPPDDVARELRELVAAGRFEEAMAAYHRTGGAEVRRPPEVELIAATAATRLGQLGTGASLATEALEGFRSRADDDGRMRAMNLLGAIGFERGELDNAERCFAEALRLAQQLQDSLMTARISNNLASVAHLRGNLAGALSLYRSALLGYQRLGDRHFIAETYHNLGVTFRQIDNWEEAERAATHAVRHAELVGDPALLGLAVTGRAEIDLERDELEAVAPELDRAARLATDAGDEIGGAEVRRLRARLALRRGDAEAAHREAEAALAVAERNGVALLRAECAASLALTFRALGLADDAERWHQEAADGFRRLEASGWLARFEREWAAG
jgi:tetratricopeptide (TPR) repeat protein